MDSGTLFAVIVLAYVIAVTLVYRSIDRYWRDSFGKCTRGDALINFLVSVILPSGIIILLLKDRSVSKWMNQPWGKP